MKKLGYFLAIGGLFCFILIIPDWKIENVKDDAVPFVMIGFLLILWTFVILPYNAITTKKKIIVQDGKFIIESNRKKHKANEDLKNLIWWKDVDGAGIAADGGSQLHLKFPYKKVILHYIDFKSFYQLKLLLKTNYKEKKKTKSYP